MKTADRHENAIMKLTVLVGAELVPSPTFIGSQRFLPQLHSVLSALHLFSVSPPSPHLYWNFAFSFFIVHCLVVHTFHLSAAAVKSALGPLSPTLHMNGSSGTHFASLQTH